LVVQRLHTCSPPIFLPS